MITNSYDVVVIGATHSGLICSALLTKRGFRVLVVGHDSPPPSYKALGLDLPRSPFTDTADHSPISRRIYAELALNQILRRRSHSVDPILQVALPDHRFELPLDQSQLLDRELEREFPAIKWPVEEFLALARSTGEVFDPLVRHNLTWPPDSFWERRRLRQVARMLPPALRGAPHPSPLDQIPSRHAFRLTLDAPLRFSSHLDPSQRSPLATARLYQGWLQGPQWIEGGHARLHRTLVDKVRSSTGEVLSDQRVDKLIIRRGAVTSVKMAGSGDEIGCDSVVSSLDLSELLRILPSRDPFVDLFDRIGEPQARLFRYTLNVVIRAEGLPVGMGRHAFMIRDPKRELSDENLLRVESHPVTDDGLALLCVQALLSRRLGPGASTGGKLIRQRVLESLRTLVPFLDEHLVMVDSPHDGLPIEDRRGGRTIEPSSPWSRGPHTMEAIFGYPVLGPMGLCALPTRSPIRRLLLTGRQVIPALGLEGELLSAWSAAKIITAGDRRKEWMRRRLWTKVEL